MAVRNIANGNINFVMSVRPSAWNNSVPIGRIFMKYYIWGFFEDLSRKFMSDQTLTRITRILPGSQCTFTVISRWIFLRTFQAKVLQKVQTINSVFNFFFFRKPRHLLHNVKTTKVFIVALQLLQLLRQRAALLRYTTFSVVIKCCLVLTFL